MQTKTEESYVLRHLALIDMGRTLRSLNYLDTINDTYLKDVLFRDAVISYAKPFSDNRGTFVKKGLKITEKGIPSELKEAHIELINLRNQLFAHMDISYQNPQLEHDEIDGEKHTSFMVKGYERVHADYLISPLKKLATLVQNKLLQEMKDIENKGFS